MRESYIDRMKAVLMYMVVLQHTLYFLNGQTYVSEQLYNENIVGNLLRFLQMPGFMLISGYFFYQTLNRYENGFREDFMRVIIKNILLGIVLPILTWGTVAYLREYIGFYSLKGYLEYLWYKFWFFKVILFCKLIFLVIHYLAKDRLTISIVIILCVGQVSWIQDNNMIQLSAMLPFWTIGYHWNQVKEKYKYWEVKKYIPIWIILFLIWQKYLVVADIPISAAIGSIRGTLLLLGSIVLKTGGCYLLCQLLKYQKWNTDIGANTIFIYPFSCIIVDILCRLDQINQIEYNGQIMATVRAIVISLVILWSSGLAAKCVKRSRVGRLILMGKR